MCVCVCGFQTVELWGALFILKGWSFVYIVSDISFILQPFDWIFLSYYQNA